MSESNEFKTITAEEFSELDFANYTLLDLREPDELLVSSMEGAINIPFAEVATRLDEVPRNKPVLVYCRSGEWSPQVAEILSDRSYEVYDLAGGYNAYRELTDSAFSAKDAPACKIRRAAPVEETPKQEEKPLFLDAKGLKCPGPIVKVADALRNLETGKQVYVEATEDAFASDIAVWAERTGNKLLDLTVEPDVIKVLLEKGDGTASAPAAAASGEDPREHEKTLVVFSGDLDKTIASLIIANGAAAMGRPVTVFFTFWGLKVLRKPKRVKVKKDLIGRMFGLMMPRGTRQLGLSRMNMGGAGAKMIRWVMKKNGIRSVEELLQDAVDHGVRLVACQMSMDIMGIKQEELIDGVELGGVATMLGSAEKSDLTYFI
ncbi:MAG: DsrE/DsrF/DrsH-like family protein [Clostridia bacterium]|nr:DsrE/DsrF/DrsH-like family protein [Clostridia bacterium]